MMLGFILSLLLCGSAVAATIYVPDDYSTIQGAIEEADFGDTIIVRPGTYVENVDFSGKSVTLISEQGPDVTFIDGNQAGSVVTFKSGELPYSRLEGFTIQNGNYLYGAGIFCTDNSDPVITNNVIKNNTVQYNYDGGGIGCRNHSNPTITHNVITENYANNNGGGISCWDGCDPLISNNMITANLVLLNGGGIYCGRGSFPTITNNIIKGNQSNNNGGGICSEGDSSPTITSNIITENTAYGGGGGICCNYSILTIANNVITGNWVTGCGGGICIGNSDLRLVNNTVTGNTALIDGGGVCIDRTDTWISNMIFWDNDAPSGPELSIMGSAKTPSTVWISYSDLEGGQSVVLIDPVSTLNWGSGMINANPLFEDPFSDDFHLIWGSPCRDAGDNSAVTESTDFEGDPRITSPRVDMGADEFHSHLYFNGDVIPGGSIQLKVVGQPGTSPVRLLLGSGVHNIPVWTQYGDLHLIMPPVRTFNLGAIPANGIRFLQVTVPSWWQSGEQFPFQALIGPKAPGSILTNLMVLTVE